MQYLLHIDTSADSGLVAISAEAKVLASKTIADSRNQATSINLLIEEVLAETGITIANLSAVAVCAGPGSYTGLRIGMATAKALCYVSDMPLMAHNKLTLLAYQSLQRHSSADIYFAVLTARENEYFLAAYDREMNELEKPAHIFAEDLECKLIEKKNILIVGDITPEKHTFLLNNNSYIVSDEILDINAWASYAFNELKCNRTVNLALAEPFYLKQVYTHKSNKDS